MKGEQITLQAEDSFIFTYTISYREVITEASVLIMKELRMMLKVGQ